MSKIPPQPENSPKLAESLPKDGHQQKPLGLFTWCCVLLSTVSAMLMGYDIGIMSGAILFIQQDLHLSLFEEEVIVGSLNLFAALGSLGAGFVSNFLGRRRALLVSSALFLVGAAVLAASVNFAWLLIGRLLTGLGVGFAMMIAPLYSAEISPARVRGFLVSFTEVFVNVGILLGYIFGFAFQFLNPTYNWRLMLGAGALPAILLAAGAFFVLPESPRWLVLQGRNDEARNVLRDVVCGKDEVEAQQRLEEIMIANEEEGGGGGCFCGAPKTPAGHGNHKGSLVSNVRHWMASPLARMYVIAIGINFFQQASGIDALVYYSPVVFKQAGVHGKVGKLGATVGMGVVKLGFVFVATYLLDHVGRKKLLYVSASGVVACLTTVAVTFVVLGLNSAKGDSLISVNDQKGEAAHSSVVGEAITIAAIFAYVAFFSVGFGPISYVLTSEIFPLRHRSTAVGVSVFVNRAVSGTVALTFLSIAKAITPAGTFGLFAGLTLLSIVFVWLLVPETKGRTLEDIAHLFAPQHAHDVAAASPRDLELAHKQ